MLSQRSSYSSQEFLQHVYSISTEEKQQMNDIKKSIKMDRKEYLLEVKSVKPLVDNAAASSIHQNVD